MPRYNSLAEARHVYATPGIYQITVTDEVTGISQTIEVEADKLTAIPGTPGEWMPPGVAPPADFADLVSRTNKVQQPGEQSTAWRQGTYVVLGDGSHAHNLTNAQGVSLMQWAVGDAPGDLGMVCSTTRPGGNRYYPAKDAPGYPTMDGAVYLQNEFQNYFYPDHALLVDWGDGTP